MFKFLIGLFKILVISLITGVGLSAFNLTAADILQQVGMTPERVLGLLQQGAEWAIPNIVLGSMVIVPVWVVVFLLRPPRS